MTSNAHTYVLRWPQSLLWRTFLLLALRAAAEAATRAAMEGAADLRVPLVVDVGFGPNWAEAK